MLVDNGIPVLGHIGLLPQSVRGMGGFRVQGRSASDIERLLADARALEQAGCFALVVEGVPPDTARQITEAVEKQAVARRKFLLAVSTGDIQLGISKPGDAPAAARGGPQASAPARTFTRDTLGDY